MTGLCHSVQGTAAMLARWIGAPMEEITYTCAGINHMAWYLKYEWNGEDAYPLIREAVTTRPEVYDEEQVRNEMFLAFDYYVTESSGHNSEYNAWFRKRLDLIEQLLHPRNRLEPWTRPVHPATNTVRVETPGSGRWRSGFTRHSTSSAAASTRPRSSMRCWVASPLRSTATSRTPA